MGKKLISVWIDAEKIENIKAKKPVSEFIRDSIDESLSVKKIAYRRGGGVDLNMCVFCIENNIPLTYDDYVKVLYLLDSCYYSDKDPVCIEDKETQIFAVVLAKILYTNFYDTSNISEHPASYYSGYIETMGSMHNPEERKHAQEHSGGFVQYVAYLIHGLKVKRFHIASLIRALGVFMRDYGLTENKEEILSLCKSLDNMLFKLAKGAIEGDKDMYKFPYSDMVMQKDA